MMLIDGRLIHRPGCFAIIMMAVLASALRADAQTGCVGVSNDIEGSITWVPKLCQEFNDPTPRAPDPAVWTYDLGGGGWGSHELEIYCGPPGNPDNPAGCPNGALTSGTTYIDGQGHLVLPAINVDGTWYSARLKTQGVKSFQYGRIEANMQLPDTTNPGLWPSIWSLGGNIAIAGWPDCGETDIMEVWPQATRGPGTTGNRATLHTHKTRGPGIQPNGRFSFPPSKANTTAFHTCRKFLTPSLIGAICLCALTLRAQSAAPNASTQNTYKGPVFEDVSQHSGLTVANISSPDKRYVIESMSGGVGLFDCDNDGGLDIVTINSSTAERYKQGGDPMVTLYHQEPDGTFKDITQSAGLTRRGWGMGVAVADFDNDGRLDLFVTGYGGNVLYRNLGGCKFEDVTDKAGVRGEGFSTGAAWADYDRDGYVDLFVARYVHVDINNLPEFGRDKFCRYMGVLVQCGPWGLPGEGDLLYHNRGDGTFEEVSVKAGVDDKEKRYGLGVVWGDYDNDGWPDLFVANDAGSNYLYHNNHNGTFTDVALLDGVALSGAGMPQGNMGVDFGDYNHDGWLDIIDTTFADQPKTLYRNLGPGGFADVSSTAHIAQVSMPDVAWGTGFVDFDNDGWPDIFIANGHVYPQVDTGTTQGARYKEPIFLHLNKHDGTFEEISSPSGLASLPLASRRGAALGDVWNDGAMDVLILNVGEPPTLLRNHLANGNHWVEFKLQGTKSNRAAIGARLTIHSGELSQFNEVRGGSSYLSQNDLRLHFGLGANTKIDSVEISWPSGLVEHLTNLAPDRIYTISEGKGIIQ